MKCTKNKFIRGFIATTLLLALVRCVFPSVAEPRGKEEAAAVTPRSTALSISAERDASLPQVASSAPLRQRSRFFTSDGQVARHRIISVPSYAQAFPDQNDVQLRSAQQWGVQPVHSWQEAEQRHGELVYVGLNPYFHVDHLKSSIPYLVPRASVLLQDIGRSFYDSLQIKGIPLHQLIVTSVLRSTDDVARLRGHNGNATQNSCHLYGTTFDVSYNRYRTVQAPGQQRRAVRNDTLKWVLAEVLRDLREQGRCHIKYEVHQGCFHITVK